MKPIYNGSTWENRITGQRVEIVFQMLDGACWCRMIKSNPIEHVKLSETYLRSFYKVTN